MPVSPGTTDALVESLDALFPARCPSPEQSEPVRSSPAQAILGCAKDGIVLDTHGFEWRSAVHSLYLAPHLRLTSGP